MELSKLIRYQNMLDELDLQSGRECMIESNNSIMTDLSQGVDCDFIDPYDIQMFGHAADKILESLDHRNRTISGIKQRVQVLRQELEKQAAETTYEYYDQNLHDPHLTERLFDFHDRVPLLCSEEIQETFLTRVATYSSWKHPGILLRPLDGTVLEAMLSSDPLYLIDERHELLERLRDLKTPAYQRRLRYKVLSEDDEQYLTGMLPHGQFGVIVAHAFFNWRTFDVIKQYLNEFWTLLKPGGVAVFTYNNGDQYGAVRNFERGLYTYIPGSLLRPLVESIGFEIIYEYSHDLNVFWFEVRKPGKLESLRGGQTLGTVKNIAE